MPPKGKVKGKGMGKGGGAKCAKPKVKGKVGPKKSGGNGGGGGCGDVFPMERGPTPSKLEPNEITRLYKLPSGKLKTEEDVIKQNGYLLEEKLDAGGFGVIFFAREKKHNTRVACKMMELGSSWNDSRVEDMKNELFIMEKVKHLYVVKLHHHFLTQSKAHGNRLYIFMQLADGGNFAKFCQKRGTLREDECKLYFGQIICGINHMHSLGIAHRDIKLQNVLLARCEKSISGDFTLLVADFGLSRILHHDDEGAVKANRTICGTPLFMAPEILLRKPYCAFSVDIWALGVTLYIMMTLELPFDFRNQNQAIKDMMARNWSWPSAKMKTGPSSELRSLTSSMIEPDMKKRLTMPQLLGNKWIAPAFKKAQALANKK